MCHDRIGKISVYIEKDEAGPLLDILAYQIFDEITLAHSAQANDGKMRWAQFFLENDWLSVFSAGGDTQQQIPPVKSGAFNAVQVLEESAYAGKHKVFGSLWQLENSCNCG
jgi:hypothetical protein